jgi:ribosomal protein L21E
LAAKKFAVGDSVLAAITFSFAGGLPITAWVPGKVLSAVRSSYQIAVVIQDQTVEMQFSANLVRPAA